MRVSFGDFELDTDTVELRRDGRPVPMEPQVFDVLAHLVRHRDRVVTKEELLDEVWGDRFVSESTLTSRIKHVRRALDDDGTRQVRVRTVHGRGYRFTAEVATAPEAPAGAPVPHNLPADRTPLFGRADDVAEVAALVGGHRLVSLLGIGGTGKTRLAAAVGQRLLPGFPDGVWFVDLVPATDPESVATAVAHAVGLAIGAGEAAAELARLLGERRVLVVLDNAEHVRDELAAVLDHLLEHTARPRFLVTSRLPLDLPDERRYPVSPLDCADPSAPGVRLLLAAAERVGAPAPDPGTAQRICQHLDGLPLAIELAGAQLRVLAADEVAARLDERFDLLRERHRPGRERHASLTAVLDGSWSLLEPDERAVLSRLAAFPGPFALADAEQLCFDLGPAVGVLARLVDRSLVAGPSDGRFRLLETVRLYAGRRGDARAEADRHARWCRDGVGPDLEAHVFDGPAAAWCTGHHDDIAAAERHLLATGRPAEAALLLAGTALAMQCDAGSHAAAALGRVDRLLTRVAGDPALTARLHITGVFAGMPARAPEAIAEHGRLAVAAAEVAGDPLLRSVALVLHSWSVVFVDPAEAIAMTERAAALAGDTDRARDLADGYRAFHLAVARRYPEAVALAEVVRGRSPSGHDAGQGRVVAVHAIAACCAVPEPQRALECLPELFDTPSESTVMWTSEVLAAAVLASCGRVAEAEGMLQRARVRLAAAGRDGLPDVLVPAAVLAHRLGDDARAARWLAAVRGHGRTTHSFHTTCVYRRLREAVGAPAAPPPSAAEAFQEATDWLRTLPA